MQSLKAIKACVPTLRNCLLVVCLIYIGSGWILSSGKPDLDEIVLKHSLGNGTSIYGARDSQGGATVGFSYRYYVHKDLASDQEILAALVSAYPFLKTKEPDVQVTDEGGGLHLVIRGEVYEYHSYALEGLGKVKVMMAL